MNTRREAPRNGDETPPETETASETEHEGLTVIAYGGGVQSTALVVLAATGQLHADAALFCNVGDDSEHPDTLVYVREVAIPWATARGFPVHELHRHLRDGTPETLMGRLTKQGSRSLPIPVRMSNGAPGRRSCTADFKIKVMAKWLKAHGASAVNPSTVYIGISTDEFDRATNRKVAPYERVEYPLLERRLDRAACAQIIRAAGLPVPPKSACYFCPFHKAQTWAEQRRDRPDLFAKSADLEALLNERRDVLGKDHVYLTRYAKPLADAIKVAQDDLWSSLDSTIGESGCDDGMCFV